MNNIKLENLNTKYIGKTLFHYNEIDSTQKEVWRRINNGDIENGTVITASIQTDGIGTHGRTWYTVEKDNIAFSLVVFFNNSIDKLDNFTLEIAEIIVDIFEKKYQIKLDIKLPNDLMIRNKKVGGILTETRLHGNIVKELVIGVGINTNQNKFPNEITDIATSIKNEFNIKVDNKYIISEFCNIFEEKIMKKL